MINDKDNLPELPKGWMWTKLEGISEIIFGQSPPSSTYNEEGEGLPFYQGKSEFGKIYPTPRKWCSKPKKVAQKGDVLISIRAPVGPTNICPEKSCIGRGLAAIRGLVGIEPLFILYLIRSFEDVISGKGTGTTFKAIRSNQLRGFEIPLPPLAEQHRIVDKIEELFSKLDAGVKSLKKAKAQLKRYRQSVLKSAMEARLTEESRNLQKDWVSGQRLLEKAEKESNINKYKARGKLTKIDKTLLYDVPDSWAWGQVGDVCEAIRYGTSDKAKKEFSGVPVLRMGDIQNGNLKFNDLKFMPEDWDKEKLLLKAGDVLFNRTNSMELVGKTAVYKEHHPTCTFASYLVCGKVFDDVYSPEFLAFYVNSFYGHRYIRSVVNQQVGQANVNATKFASMPIPIPSLAEQHKIVEELERRLSVVDEVEKVVDSELKRAERLRHSILKQAFSGKLAPQDPDDEPASVLLERIKKEKERKESVKSSKKKSKAKTDAKQLNLF